MPDETQAPEWFVAAFEDALFRHHGVISSGGKDTARDLWSALLAEGQIYWDSTPHAPGRHRTFVLELGREPDSQRACHAGRDRNEEA